MKVTEFTRGALANRKQKRKLLAKGYEYLSDPIWEISRGFRFDEKIVDVIISENGKSLYLKCKVQSKEKA